MLLKMSKTALCPLILFSCLPGIVHAGDISTHVFGGKKVSLDATTDTVKAGYYAATTLHAVDPALKPANIAVSTAIFGVIGTYTSDATAQEANILTGQTFYAGAGGVLRTGNVPVGASQTGAQDALIVSIPNGIYSGSDKTATARDDHLVVGNIKKGVAIFGITGTFAGGGLPDTGQTVDYTTTFGEDSDYVGAQLNYTDNSDGTVTDMNTGLMWVKSGYADAATTPPTTHDAANNPPWWLYTWFEAINYCERLIYPSYADWRLPNIKELFSIVKYAPGAPLIDQGKFPATYAGSYNTFYWSSTTSIFNTDDAVSVYFDKGFMSGNNKQYVNAHVRCVRTSP